MASNSVRLNAQPSKIDKIYLFFIIGLCICLLVVFGHYCIYRVMPRRRLRGENGTRRRAKPECHDVWLGAPAQECAWRDVKPLSLEKAVTPLADEPPSQRRRSALLTKLFLLPARDMDHHDNTKAPTVCSESTRRGEDQPPDVFRIAVLVAMPSPLASTRQCGYMNVGVANIICEG
ncbi:hypothetical protein BDZ89DRAFT_103429 [Hymenopellis radicata]|nr:hypothetical protein BDZ89DRAFT_103429 [Hymenopellis radicata]